MQILQKQIISKRPFTLEIIELENIKSYVLKIEDYRVQEEDVARFIRCLEELIQTIHGFVSRFEVEFKEGGHNLGG